MIEVSYRTGSKTPAPRSPELILPSQRGDRSPRSWIDESWRNAQTVGLELLWTEAHTMVVTSQNAIITTEFELPTQRGDLRPLPPDPPRNIVEQLDDEYYRVRLDQQIITPRGFCGYLLPHPRFYDSVPRGCYNDTPAVIPRLLNLDVSPEPIDLICRLPWPGDEQIFYSGMPIAQLMIVPRGHINACRMSGDDENVWATRLRFLQKHGREDTEALEQLINEIRKNGWTVVQEKYDAHN